MPQKLSQEMAAPHLVNYPVFSIPPGMVAEIPPEQWQLVPTPNAIATRKYATSVDDRSYITVYEYAIRDQWVIWDFHTGYVHLTGLWKALGNTKADIVRLVDTSPELENCLKRVRGGYLKIQGTWVPFDIAKQLAARTCFAIRYALVPIFGPNFPSLCLRPGDVGFGMLRLRDGVPVRKRRRRAPSNANATPRRKSDIAGGSARNGVTKSITPHRRNASLPNTSQLQLATPITAQPVFSDSEPESPAFFGTTEPRGNSKFHSSRKQGHNRYPDYIAVPITPPPMPNKLVLPDGPGTTVGISTQEFAAMLAAGRSLQQLSACQTFDCGKLGGEFEYGGVYWRWNGAGNVEVVSYRGFPGSSAGGQSSVAQPIRNNGTNVDLPRLSGIPAPDKSTPRGMAHVAVVTAPSSANSRRAMNIQSLLS